MKATLCNKCNLPITFKKLASGKLCPTNPDGSDHWDDCSKAKRAGRQFNPATDMKESRVQRGEHYVAHACTCIHWEDCTCTASQPGETTQVSGNKSTT